MTAGLVSSQFCIFVQPSSSKKVTDNHSDVRGYQKRTWRSTRSRNPRRRARQVGYAVEIGHSDTHRLGLSINTRVICNVCWNTWAEGDVVKFEKSLNSLIIRTSTYSSLVFGLIQEGEERCWGSKCSYSVYAESCIELYQQYERDNG
jgi:hypothetical protein